ncbi:lytic transglycosylase domain-containing protein [Thalassospiraceae bacterium LMO-JJ14]|nr:lytic transglycosylase domain-containing protein [Thalassospiraceae bacterium LMO-JJ14]
MTKVSFRLAHLIAAAAIGILMAVSVDVPSASAQPRMPGNEALSASALPQILGDEDIRLYQRIFELQEDGNWKTADQLIKRLSDPILMGHVLYQRYMHPTKYRSKYKELKDWMADYADHPSAGIIYKLALRRRPSNWRMPVPPKVMADAGVLLVRPSFQRIHVPGKTRSVAERRQARSLRNQIKRVLRRGQTLTAKRLILAPGTKRLLSAAEYDEARVGLAKGYFIDGRDEWGLEWVLPALERSGKYLPEGHWTAGLLLWRAEKYADAAAHFEAAARNTKVSDWMASASAFWAARSHMAAHKPAQVVGLLEQAAEHPRTFYGLLAIRLLGRDLPFNWAPPAFKGDSLHRLSENPRGRRAIALMQIGDDLRAESELKDFIRGADRPMLEGIHALAARGNMASIAVRLDTLLYPDGGGYDGVAYPIPDYIPVDGFSVDRALVYALIRQESRFNPKAKSWAGARGLMQLMPRTARFVARSTGMRLRERSKLYTPETNLELGQRYIAMLLDENDVSMDLFKLAVAWNGGPGNLRKWERRTKHLDDPIFFIESIPSFETRTFVERVLTNFWIYRHRLGQDTPSLDAVARGEWPTYQAMGPGDSEIAANAPRN